MKKNSTRFVNVIFIIFTKIKYITMFFKNKKKDGL